MAEDIHGLDFKVGDEVWRFQSSQSRDSYRCEKYRFIRNLCPGQIELVHDIVLSIEDDLLICQYETYGRNEVWGKSREEAFAKLKENLEQWGKLE